MVRDTHLRSTLLRGTGLYAVHAGRQLPDNFDSYATQSTQVHDERDAFLLGLLLGTSEPTLYSNTTRSTQTRYATRYANALLALPVPSPISGGR